MRILIIGGGGREHALAWALANSRSELFIAPGNAGTEALGQNVPIGPGDVADLVKFASRERIDLTVVGPEVPLVNGVSDAFEASRLPIVGPSARAAAIEGSKAFAKDFMLRNNIPTAAYRTFTSDQYAEACEYVQRQGSPIVVKASGLAAGKGAIVCATLGEARDALDRVMRSQDFGAAGEEVVVESFMEGEEASIFAVTDGEEYVLLAPAQDHKRIGEGDTGPNTGGMGAYAPAPIVTSELLDEACKQIIEPTLSGLAREGRLFKGFLYAGLMVTDEGPKVVEFNCRLGDPEAQVVIPLLDADWTETLLAVAQGRLGNHRVALGGNTAACVVMASEGYPGKYEKGLPVTGLKAAEEVSGAVIFHAGTRSSGAGQVVTAGGRVLGVTAVRADLRSALEGAYEAAGRIHFEGAQYRRDIGRKGLARIEA